MFEYFDGNQWVKVTAEELRILAEGGTIRRESSIKIPDGRIVPAVNLEGLSWVFEKMMELKQLKKKTEPSERITWPEQVALAFMAVCGFCAVMSLSMAFNPNLDKITSWIIFGSSLSGLCFWFLAFSICHLLSRIEFNTRNKK
ncbi:MAG: hypothetical protein LBQ54_13265 [Planctomycetaceae bacterium]|nr:hypothetical protein [Planctomycetaceae bacterium]